MIKFKGTFEIREIFGTRHIPFVPNKDLKKQATPLLLQNTDAK